MYCPHCGQLNATTELECTRCRKPLPPRVIAPAATTSSPAEDPSGFDAEMYEAAVGSDKAAYYLPRFRALHEGQAGLSWHWPAFFLTFYWMLHRRMWLAAAAYIAAPALLAFLLAFALVLLMGEHGPAGLITNVVVFGLTLLAPPMLANRLYFGHCRKLVERVSHSGVKRSVALMRVRAKGGTSLVAAVVIAMLLGVAVIGVLAAVALPAYQDYTTRAKATEALMSGDAVRSELSAHHARTGRLPRSLEEAGIAAPYHSPYLRELAYDASTGELQYHVDTGRRQFLVTMTPRVSAQRVVWNCRVGAGAERWVPVHCRG